MPAVPAVPVLAEGETLHARLSGAAADASSTFVWQRCVPGVCTTVAGEHKGDYQLTAADLHTRIRVVVTRRGGQRLTVTTTGVVGTLAAASRAPASLVSPLVPTDAGTLSIVLAAGPHRSLQRPPIVRAGHGLLSVHLPDARRDFPGSSVTADRNAAIDRGGP